jgi:hypothetical protein
MVAKPNTPPGSSSDASPKTGASGVRPSSPPAVERSGRLAAAHKRVLDKFAPTFAKLAE